MKVWLVRRGTFEVKTVRNAVVSNACGSMSHRRFLYRVRIMCPVSQLDKQGFIIDNEKIQALFDTLGTREWSQAVPSCEHMALFVCKTLRLTFQLRKQLISEIEVTVAGSPKAGITAFWKAKQRSKVNGKRTKVNVR
jgi:hypothetical protein